MMMMMMAASEMDEQGVLKFQAQGFVQNKDKCWMKMEDMSHIDDDDDDDDGVTSTSSESSLGAYSRSSNTSQESSTSSSDLVDDASSSNSSSNSNNGPLYELSELMAQLPIKRGLSKYFQGKSQSFTSLSSVKSLEDLAKKESPYSCGSRKKMKACKSYGGGLDTHKLYTLPRATISKKVSRNSFLSTSFPAAGSSRLSRNTSTFLNGKPPLIPAVHKNFSSV